MAETGEIMLFGVRFVVDSIRKCVSLNNLSQYEHTGDSPKEDSAAVAGAGYVSADEALAQPASGSRGDRKRGVAWTEEEHKLFLLGLKRVGKGDWRGISRNYVKTRTPTQVASHAQKYFLRHANVNRRRRRSSLFDITTDSVSAIPMEEEQSHEQDMNNTGSRLHLFPSAPPETSNGSAFSALSAINRASSPVLPVSVEKLGNMLPEKVNEVPDLSTSFNRPVAILPAASRDTPFLDLNLDLDLTPSPAPCDTPVLDLNLDLNLIPTVEPAPVSLDLLLSSDRSSTSRHSAFQLVQGYNNLDNFIGVA